MIPVKFSQFFQLFLNILILSTYFLILKIDDFRGDVNVISAKTTNSMYSPFFGPPTILIQQSMCICMSQSGITAGKARSLTQAPRYKEKVTLPSMSDSVMCGGATCVIGEFSIFEIALKNRMLNVKTL